jgi:hypothetical protein
VVMHNVEVMGKASSIRMLSSASSEWLSTSITWV